MIRVICTCGKAFKAEDRHAGRRTKCPVCGTELTVGPASGTPVNGVGGDGVPTWWDATGTGEQAARGTAPTHSGSDPGPDAAVPMVRTAGHVPQLRPRTASGPPASQPAPKAAAAGLMAVLRRPSSPAGTRWALAGVAGAVVVVALGAFLWLRPRTPGADAVVPPIQGAATDGTGDSGRGRAAATSAPAGEPRSSAKPIAGTSVAIAPADDSAAAPKADADDPPRLASAGEPRRLQLLVPAYIYPSGEGRNEWDRLLKAASKVKIVAIANPNSGPGEERNLEYNAIFVEAAEKGVTVVGYVSTDFGKRDQAAIEKDVETWLTFYPQIRGFFFDQQPRDGHSVVQFARLRDYVKRKRGDAVLITNPGVPCDEAYLAQDVSNITCVFVNFQGFEHFELPQAYKSYDPSRFAALPYGIPDAKIMREFVRDAIVKRIGYIYVSDAKQPNPWAKLPAYWEEEVDAISRLR